MNKAIFGTNIENMIELTLEDNENSQESSASISLNPVFTWTKFILTDDKPNGNNQRIPKEEFSNLIKTGIFAPVKMSFGKINEDHSDAFPIGVITHLKQIDDKIEGIAALWSKERDDDVLKIKDMVKNGDLPQLSWEIMYEDTKEEDGGIVALANTVLRGITIVAKPAYAGRTPIFAAASTNKPVEDLNVEELEILKTKVSDLEIALSTKDAELTALKTQVAEKDTELTSLKEYKASIEEKELTAKKLTEIKEKFANAKLNKDEEYFKTNEETLLGLSESALDFMIQELVAFSALNKKTETSASDKGIPNFSSDNELQLEDPKVLAEALRKLYK